MANLEARMQEYAQKQGISVVALRKKLDSEMKERSGPTFEEGLEHIHYVIDPPRTKYSRANDVLQINTDFMTAPEAVKTIDQAMGEFGVSDEVLAVMEVAISVKPKFHSKKRKDEGIDPLFEIHSEMRDW